MLLWNTHLPSTTRGCKKLRSELSNHSSPPPFKQEILAAAHPIELSQADQPRQQKRSAFMHWNQRLQAPHLSSGEDMETFEERIVKPEQSKHLFSQDDYQGLLAKTHRLGTVKIVMWSKRMFSRVSLRALRNFPKISRAGKVVLLWNSWNDRFEKM